MVTKGLEIINHRVPCSCACRYCFFQSHKSAQGVDYARGEALARRFDVWKKDKHPEGFVLDYAVSYCMDYPELLQNIALNQSLGFIGYKYLQCNGIRYRNDEQLHQYLSDVRSAGVESVDTTFYGLAAYHDAFAAREGDYELMMRLARAAAAHGLICNPTVFLCEENMEQVPILMETLRGIDGIGSIHSFLQDFRGNGRRLEAIRLTDASYKTLPDEVKATCNKTNYRTQSEWLSSGELPEYTSRILVLSLTPEGIDRIEAMSCDEVIVWIEELDDTYYNTIPSINELARMYGDRDNQRLYRMRDLYWKWQRRYVAEHNLTLHDVTDERYCGSLRR